MMRTQHPGIVYNQHTCMLACLKMSMLLVKATKKPRHHSMHRK
jgi:hypothetical protein